MRHFTSLLPALLLFISINLSATEESSAISEKESTDLLSVTVVTANRATLRTTTTIRGEIESGQTPQVAAKIAGEVESLLVDEGAIVKTGDLLATLDSEPFAIALSKVEADIDRLAVVLKNQQRNLERVRQQKAQDLTAEDKLDDAETAVKLTRAELVSAAVRQREARYQLTHTRILSPINGRVQQRMISLGDFVTVGKPLLQLIDDALLRARLYLPASLQNSVKIGSELRLQQAGDQVTARVTHIRPMLQNQTRSLQLIASLSNQAAWRAGSAVTATLLLTEHPEVVTVPLQTVVLRPVGPVVYEVKEGVAYARPVVTGIRDQGLVEIISGLDAGAVVVDEGASFLSDRSRVEIRTTEERSAVNGSPAL
ncbi:MAG: efflux RND transporter periplasmic adaptor subunit [Gammaproteobacteria bacterium]|nr:efflux RND transporter periplasmic adaptor subunit [Gammaproteobacteria bacterium]